MRDFDAIIIGSGIGGLVNAGILVSKGLKVLMVERQKTPGGYLASFQRRGFCFDSAVDVVSGVEPGGLIYRTLELLNVQNDISFARIDPIRVSIFPDLEIAVDADVEAYMDRLSSFFPSESAGIKSFFRTSQGVYDKLLSMADVFLEDGARHISPDLLKLMGVSHKELLDEHLSDYRLKAVLSDRCPFIGLPPSEVSAHAMAAMVMSYFKQGAYRPVGGSRKLADVLVHGIRKSGGEVVLANGARRILTGNKGECRGIICDNGDEYTSRYVVSNADFSGTFCNLLGGEYSRTAQDMIKSRGVSTSFFIVYAGVRGEDHRHSSIGYFPSYELEASCKPGRGVREDSTIGITIASIEDKSRAPEGRSTVVLHELVEASREKFDKSCNTEAALRKIERIIPGIRDRIEVLDSATPLTLERYTGNSMGAAFGWRQVPGLRGIKHGVKNLFIAGHWGDRGGGVLSAAYSGAKTAKEILALEGVSLGR